jgi:hypothetical protein
MRLFKENIKVIAKVSLVMILLSFLGLKSKAADNGVINPICQKVVVQVAAK